MGDEKRDRTDEATSFFNRGRRLAAGILRDNELLRSRIRRLEQKLRATIGPGRRRDPESDRGDKR